MKMMIQPNRSKDTLRAKRLLGKQESNVLRKAEISVKNSRYAEKKFRHIPKDDIAMV